jgi:head-tail adaptor
MSVIKISQSANLLRHRVTLLEKKLKEQENGSFIEEINELGKVWARLIPASFEQLSNTYEWHKTKGLRPRSMYQVAMRKYFSCNARHAKINALRFNHKVLDLLYRLQLDEKGEWLAGLAADYGREGNHG